MKKKYVPLKRWSSWRRMSNSLLCFHTHISISLSFLRLEFHQNNYFRGLIDKGDVRTSQNEVYYIKSFEITKTDNKICFHFMLLFCLMDIAKISYLFLRSAFFSTTFTIVSLGWVGRTNSCWFHLTYASSCLVLQSCRFICKNLLIQLNGEWWLWWIIEWKSRKIDLKIWNLLLNHRGKNQDIS